MVVLFGRAVLLSQVLIGAADCVADGGPGLGDQSLVSEAAEDIDWRE